MIPVSVNLKNGVADARYAADISSPLYLTLGRDTFSGVYQVIGTAFDDLLVGGSAGRTSLGVAIEGFRGGAGNDWIDGGDGKDSAIYNDSPKGITVDLRLSSGQVQDGWGFVDTLVSIEKITGSNYADSVVGGAGDDTFEGLMGADWFDGGAGVNTISFAESDSGVTVRLSGWVGSTGFMLATAQGSALDGYGSIDQFTNVQAIEGSNFNDLIVGDANNNILEGRGGNDTIDGGDGIDWVVYDHAMRSVIVDLSAYRASDDGEGQGDAAPGDAIESDLLLNIENVRGGWAADRITGDSKANVLQGGAGNDTLIGGAGNDTLDGGDGEDTVILSGAFANYSIQFDQSSKSYSVVAKSGSDGSKVLISVENVVFSDKSVVLGSYLVGTLGSDNLVGGSADDTILGGEGNDTISGGAGNDSLSGGPGADDFVADSGNDTIDGGAILDVSNRLTDRNSISYSSSPLAVKVNLATGIAQDGYGGVDTLRNINIVIGSAFNDLITGSSANYPEIFIGGAGNDTIDGGTITSAGIAVDNSTGDLLPGNSNLAGYSNAKAAVQVDLAIGSASGGDGNDALININGVTGSDYADTLKGSNASEYFIGGAGNDTIDAGPGFDFAGYGDAPKAVNVNLETGVATDGYGSTDNLLNIEGVEGSKYNDTLTGDLNDNYLSGRDGSDRLSGGAGNDTLAGGLGDDFFYPGPGSDLIIGGEQRSVPWLTTNGDYDRLVYTSSAGITVNLSTRTVSVKGEVGTDSYTGIEQIQGGANVADIFSGRTSGSAQDVAVGGSTIWLLGNGGSDTFNLEAYGYQQSWTSGIAVDYSWSSTPIRVSGNGATVSVSYAASGAQLAGTDTIINLGLLGGTPFDDIFDLSKVTISSGGYITDTEKNASSTYLYLGYGGSDTVIGNGVTRVDFTYVTISSNGTGANIDLRLGVADLSNLGNGILYLGTFTYSGVNFIAGTKFSDTLIGGVASNDNIEVFRGNGGDDYIDGGRGYDRASYKGSSEGVQIDLALGRASSASSGADTLRSIEDIQGSNYADTFDARGFVGGYVSTTANVGSIWWGQNAFQGEGGDDIIIGNGSTRIYYSNSMLPVKVDLQQGFADARYEADKASPLYLTLGRDTLSGVYSIVGSAYDDQLFGGGAGNTAIGRAFEVFRGGAGNDFIDGRDGNDKANYSDSPAGITVDLRLSSGQVQDGWGFVDTLVSIEQINGTNYADSVIGGAGDDTFEGLMGADWFDGGAGVNTISFAESDSGVTVRLSGWVGSTGFMLATAQGSALDGYGSIDQFTNVQAIEGSNFNDLIVGDANNNILEGRGGNDTIDGGDGIDWVVYDHAMRSVIVDLSAYRASDDGEGQGDAAPGDAIESDLLISIENVRGGWAADRITGDSRANVLQGGAGNDTIDGGGGTDTAVFSGVFANYTVNFDVASGNYLISDRVGGDGTDTLKSIEIARFSDRSINLSPALDFIQPTIALATSKSTPLIAGQSASISFTLSKVSTNFVASDVTVSGGVLSNFTGSGTSYTATFTPATNSTTNGVVSIGSGVFTDLAGNENADGSDSNNRLTFTVNTITGLSVSGTAGNDSLVGGTGNDTVDGGTGLDTLTYSGVRANYSVASNGYGYSVTSSADGVDAITNIERIKFSDGTLALDLGVDQSAGQAVLLLGTVLPFKLAIDASKQSLLGSVIGLIDSGFSMPVLSGALLRLDIWSILTGQSVSSKSRTLAEDTLIVNYLLTNVNGMPPDSSTLNAAADTFHNEPAQGAWMAQLALSTAGQSHIGLIGLSATGVSYI